MQLLPFSALPLSLYIFLSLLAMASQTDRCHWAVSAQDISSSLWKSSKAFSTYFSFDSLMRYFSIMFRSRSHWTAHNTGPSRTKVGVFSSCRKGMRGDFILSFDTFFLTVWGISVPHCPCTVPVAPCHRRVPSCCSSLTTLLLVSRCHRLLREFKRLQ